MDLLYASRFRRQALPEAYERLLLEVRVCSLRSSCAQQLAGEVRGAEAEGRGALSSIGRPRALV